MLILENAQFRFSTPKKSTTGQRWDLELVEPSDHQGLWVDHFCPDRKVPDPSQFLEIFSKRWPTNFVFSFEDLYIVDLFGGMALGDFSIGGITREVSRISAGRFNQKKTTMLLYDGAANLELQPFLAIVANELEKIRESA